MLDKIRTPKELAGFLMLKEKELIKIQPETAYKVFQIPKPGKNEKRTIETPTGILEPLLHRLCDGLQWLYLEHKTDAAYGFIRSIKNDADKRNIYTNARRHLGNNYLLNIDFDNFFYQVDIAKVKNIFNDYSIFSFTPETEELLTRLVTFKGRLPMGSSTSPPLSNFATISLDNDLLKWARGNHITYTRYVDDLSFSSKASITDRHYEQITQLLQTHRFVADPQKIKWYGKADVKEITGLIVGKTVTVSSVFIDEFEKELQKLKELYAYTMRYPDYHVMDWIDKLKQVIHGRLAFIQMVYGKNHPVYLKLWHRFENLDDDAMAEQSISWRYAGYEFH
jgi:RNA-directed DNA polymerase